MSSMASEVGKQCVLHLAVDQQKLEFMLSMSVVSLYSTFSLISEILKI